MALAGHQAIRLVEDLEDSRYLTYLVGDGAAFWVLDFSANTDKFSAFVLLFGEAHTRSDCQLPGEARLEIADPGSPTRPSTCGQTTAPTLRTATPGGAHGVPSSSSSSTPGGSTGY